MTQPNISGSNILIVDDKSENLTVLTQMLIEQGYKVRPAISGQVALKAAREKLPDLILLDIMMPGMDGYDVCKQLKADERTHDIPVIFISSLDEMTDKLAGFALGGVDYITKPFQVKEVLARVETHLALRTVQKQLEEKNVQLEQKVNEHEQAKKALQHRNRELSLLNRVSQMFSSSLELEEVVKTALGEIQRLLDVVSTSVWLIVPETDELICMQATGPGSDDVTNSRLAPGQGITGWVAQHGESVIVPDTWIDERHFKTVDKQTEITIRSMIAIPLRIKGEVIGVLNLVDPKIGCFTSDDLILLEPIATAAAIAIENARLYTTAQQEIAERWRAEAELIAAHNELTKKNAQLREANASKDKL